MSRPAEDDAGDPAKPPYCMKRRVPIPVGLRHFEVFHSQLLGKKRVHHNEQGFRFSPACLPACLILLLLTTRRTHASVLDHIYDSIVSSISILDRAPGITSRYLYPTVRLQPASAAVPQICIGPVVVADGFCWAPIAYHRRSHWLTYYPNTKFIYDSARHSRCAILVQAERAKKRARRRSGLCWRATRLNARGPTSLGVRQDQRPPTGNGLADRHSSFVLLRSFAILCDLACNPFSHRCRARRGTICTNVWVWIRARESYLF